MTRYVRTAENGQTSSTGRSSEHTEEMMSRVEKLYDAGGVKRLHTVPTVHQHTVAEHVYGSMLIAAELYKLNVKHAAEENLTLSWERIMGGLLYHDAPEVHTGDIPTPVKRASPTLRTEVLSMEQRFYTDFNIFPPCLNEVEMEVVKAADIIDLGMCCVRERLMGNRHPELWHVFDNVINYLHELNHLEGVGEMMQYMQSVWSSV